MKKVLIILAVIIAIIAIAATVFVGKLDTIIAQTIESEGTETLGSKVSVGSVVTQLAEGSATITGLTIANPPGYKKANAIEIGSFNARVDYKNQLIEDVSINSPTINAEILGNMTEIIKSRNLDGIRSNFNDLVDNMPADEEEGVVEEEDDTVITINRFAIQNATVNLTADLLGERSFPMDNFVLTNLSGTTDQISDQITDQLTAHIQKQVKDYAVGEIQPLIKAAVKSAVEAKASEVIKDELNEKLGGRLKNLNLKFGR